MNTALTKLKLRYAGLCWDLHVAGALLGALVGHPSLRELHVTGERNTAITTENRSVFGAALGALVAADAPTLQVLDCSYNNLGGAGLTPIAEALPLNHHLYELNVGDNGMTEAFARNLLLPAVRANTTLRALQCGFCCSAGSVAEAEELARGRAQLG